MNFTKKQLAYLQCDAFKEFLEGTTFSGKTFTTMFKMHFKVITSPYQEHLIIGSTKGQVEKNILGDVDDPDSYLYFFKGVSTYYPSGHGNKSSAYLSIKCVSGKNIIHKTVYIMGADDVSTLSRVRGMNRLGCVYIDELNKCNFETAQEALMRANEWGCGSLNPDDPNKKIYEIVNKSRPLPEWADDVPNEIKSLLTGPKQDNWVYWHFNFNDNPACTDETVKNKKAMYVEGSQAYNSMILGLRTKNEGLIITAFNNKNHIINKDEIKKHKFVKFSAGIDTSYSSKTDDKLTIEFMGITNENKCVVLKEMCINNKDLPESKKVYASDFVIMVEDFLEKCQKEYGYAQYIYIDNADSNTIGEFRKYARNHGTRFTYCECNKKKYDVKARNRIVNSWFKNNDLFVSSECKNLIDEYNSYAYDEKGDIIPANDHSIDAFNYSWTALYKTMIGQSYYNSEE